MVWFGAWLFTIGYLRLTFWKGVFAIVLWPYYLGVMFSAIPRWAEPLALDSRGIHPWRWSRLANLWPPFLCGF